MPARFIGGRVLSMDLYFHLNRGRDGGQLACGDFPTGLPRDE